MSAGSYAEINIFCIILITVFLYKIESNSYMKRKHHMLSMVIIDLILLFVFDMVWVLIDGGAFDSGISMNYFVNMGYFIATAVGAFLYYIYCLHIQGSVLIRNRNLLAIGALPCIALVVLAISSPLHHILFYIDENNVYHRGDFNFLSSVIANAYFLTTTAVSLVNAAKKENKSLRNLYLSFGFFAFLPIAGVLLQFWLPGYSMISVSMTLGILIIYLQILDSQVVVDRLTLLYNSNWFYRNNILNPIINEPGIPDKNFILLLDIDGLKLINESRGYVEGDRALALVSKVLLSLDKSANGMGDFTPVRYGDDEFLVICELNDSTDMNIVTEYIYSELTRLCTAEGLGYKFDVSIGYAPYKSTKDDVDLVIEAADANMFNNKKLKRY